MNAFRVELDEWQKNEACPRCGKRRYDNPNMQLYAAPCGHWLCDVCLEEIFYNRQTVRCPTCSADRRRTDYKLKLFETGDVHRDVYLRQNEIKDLQLVTQQDLEGADDKQRADSYNDYLEQVEDITYLLTYGGTEKAELARRQLRAMYDKYGKIIEANKRKAEDLRRQRELERRLQRQQEREKQRIAEMKAKQEQQRKRAEEDNFIKELTRADDASKVLRERQAKKKREILTMGGFLTSEAPTVKTEPSDEELLARIHERKEYPVWSYRRPQRHWRGPAVPPTPQLPSAAVLQNLPAASTPTFANTTAGGYLPEYTLKRAMEEAFVAMLL